MSGDKSAFDTLVRKHYNNIYAYCYRRTGNEQTAADLTQEVFLRLVKSIYSYRFSGKFSNYLFTVAVNVTNDHFRKNRSYEEYPDELPSHDDTPEQAAVKKERDDTLYKRLLCLPDKQREAIILHYFHGFKAREIAALTGVKVPTVKSRLRQGVAKLRKIYEKERTE